jgi:hypothetical protein
MRNDWRTIVTLFALLWPSTPQIPGLGGMIQASSEPTPSCWTSEAIRFSAGQHDQVMKLAADFLVSAEDLADHPYWPKGNSGITIGVGWDLGHHSQQDFLKTWAGLGTETLKKLQIAVGKRGSQAEQLVPSLKTIVVPRDVSLAVFQGSLSEDYYPQLLGLFPGVENLPAEVQVALLSVVFNRGTVLGHDPNWKTATELDRRWEMRRLQDDVKRGDLFAIYIRLGTMKRIWETTGPRGLMYRRRNEQHLIRPYVDKELHWEESNDAAKEDGRPRCIQQ